VISATRRPWAGGFAAACLSVLAPTSLLRAQSSTTAAIAGWLTDTSGVALSEAEILVSSQITGASTHVRSHADGSYLVPGLEVGGPYDISVRRLGSVTVTQRGIFLSLGQRLNLDLRLESQPVALPRVTTTAARSRIFSRANKGIESLIDDSTIHRMPIVNRDMYDLVRLVPEVATWNVLSAGGVGARANNYQIDGLSDQTVFGGVPAGSALGGRSISLEAVKEYQVLLSPFDVRFGNFSGATINAVTRRGTNDLHGSAFAYGTNEQFGRDVAFIRDARYSKAQFGFSLGGPIIRDRLHFFIVPEFQQRLIPAMGPYVGQDPTSDTPVPVASDDVARFQQVLLGYGLDGGSAAAVNNRNPASNLFARLDAPLSRWNSRLVLLGNLSRADSFVFARPTPAPNSNCPTTACFPLSSLRQRRSFAKQSFAAQLYSTLPGGGYNELIAGTLITPSSIGPTKRQPLVLVTVRGVNGQPAVMQAGSHEISTADSTGNWSVQLTDNLTIPFGTHRVSIGAATQAYRVRRFDLRGAYSIWEFASLDSLQAGLASRYRVTRNVGTADVSLEGNQYGLYLSDEWEPSPRLSLTTGIRADVPVLTQKPPYMPSVDSLLHRRTDRVPSGQWQWSPRIGFNYDAGAPNGPAMQIRGGVGLFTGRPPTAWLFDPFANYGMGTPTLTCGSLTSDVGPPPAFRADYRDPPTACANGRGFGAATVGEIDILDPGLRLPQTLRFALAADRELPFGIVGTLSGLYTHGVRTLFFTNANLGEPLGVDSRGRVMYGTIASTGLATPNRITSRLGDVIAVSNQSKDYSYDLTAQLQKNQSTWGSFQVAVTHARARDVQSHRAVRPVLIDNWRLSRTVAGRQSDLSIGISDYDQPVRLRASGTLFAPWRRWATDFSFYYVGGSGMPYSYIAGGAAPRGDLNGDGATGNDPIYIPRSALDTAEIRFAGTAAEVAEQQASFERFIDGAECLRRQRGRIMARNSCRTPWTNSTNVAVRQALTSSPERTLALELQVFNFLNLLNDNWGHVQLPTLSSPSVSTQVAVLSQTGQTAGDLSQSQPIYRFDTTMRRYSIQNIDSYYQIQLGVRYAF